MLKLTEKNEAMYERNGHLLKRFKLITRLLSTVTRIRIRMRLGARWGLADFPLPSSGSWQLAMMNRPWLTCWNGRGQGWRFWGSFGIVCDTANTPRIETSAIWMVISIKIDHHPNDDAYGDLLLGWLQTQASTSELIAPFAKELDLELPGYAARSMQGLSRYVMLPLSCYFNSDLDRCLSSKRSFDLLPCSSMDTINLKTAKLRAMSTTISRSMNMVLRVWP